MSLRHRSDANPNDLIAQLRRERDEALEQQTATAEVLQVINSSPGDLAPVFDAILEKAHTLCGATIGALEIWDGGHIRAFATRGLPGPFDELIRQGYRPGPDDPHWQLVDGARFVHVPDQASVVEPTHQKAVELAGIRTFLAVALRKENLLLGRIVAARKEVRPFSDKEIALLQNFAAQAVIAMENARLLSELRESLQQQTATADVLGVISRSAFDLQPVFDTIAENAVKLCEAERAFIFRFDGEVLRAVASYNAGPEYKDWVYQNPIKPGRQSISARAALERQTIHVPDVQADPEYSYGLRDVDPIRTTLAVPILKDDRLVGTITIYRLEVKPFTDKQIALVETFADQAVIAIENVRLFDEVQARTDDLSESLDQQTATSEVLKVISSSPGELEPVFNAMLENATRICDAKFGTLYLYDGEAFHATAFHNAPAAFVEQRTRGPLRPGPDSTLGRVASTRQVAHTVDSKEREGYRQGDPFTVAGADLGGYRSIVSVPMLKEDKLVGVITIYRQEVQPFSDKQVELLTNFAAQAVIAIENTRLLAELRESLDQQTANSEVLKVISSSPGAVEPVFQAMLGNATRICEAKFGFLWLLEGEQFRAVALHGVPLALANTRQRDPTIPASPQTVIGRALRSKSIVHVQDLTQEQAYRNKYQPMVELVEVGGARTLLVVPMLKDNDLVGAISIYRQEVRPFTEKQIALMQNFAAQAVIAIENARLLNELRQRTDDLTESLEQQTATSEVLKVISSSQGELESVFQTILANATRICGASFANLMLFEDNVFRRAALYNPPLEYLEFSRRSPLLYRDKVPSLNRLADTNQAVQVADMAVAEPDSPMTKFGRARTLLTVPMLKDTTLVGAIGIYRQDVRPFTDKQIELVQNFAAQAVIAIENARLLSELRESLQQQTATSDVLKAISRSTFDLQTVLDALVESVARLCRADTSTVRIARDGVYHNLADFGFQPEHRERVRSTPLKVDRTSMVGRVVLERKPIHILDAQADTDITGFAARSRSGNVRSMLGVPLLREGSPIGVLLLQRHIIEPFTDKQIELATTFADQAVIAIENVRLFDEIQDKSRQLAEASQHKSQFLANMSHELRTPLNAILGYTELIADGIYGEPPEKMLAVLKRVESNGKHLLGLINAVLDLSKIEAGQLVLDLADYSFGDVAHTVYSAVEPLAADKKLTFRAEVARDLPRGRGDERRLTQVLLNLVGNAIKFTDAGEVVIKASASNGSFDLSVRDTGPGISPADQTKLFQEFKQADNSLTRKKGGTGLGLAISKRIVEMHGGRIWVESVVGEGSTFACTIPVRVEQQVKVE